MKKLFPKSIVLLRKRIRFLDARWEKMRIAIERAEESGASHSTLRRMLKIQTSILDRLEAAEERLAAIESKKDQAKMML